MAIFWKLILDVLLISSIAGALGFVTFVKQKEIYLYTNVGLLFVVCFLSLCYFSSVRKRDLITWLEKHRSSERRSVTNIKRNLKTLLTAGPPYWALLYLNVILSCLITLFPFLMGVILYNNEDYTISVTCTVLIAISIFYLLVIMICVSCFKTRFKVEFNGGSLLLFVGVFLMFSNYGPLQLFIGGLLTFLGLWLHFDMWKQCYSGVSICIDRESPPFSNGDATGITASPIQYLEGLRRFIWHLLV